MNETQPDATHPPRRAAARDDDVDGGLCLSWTALLLYAGVLLHAYAGIPLALLPLVALVGVLILFLLLRALAGLTEKVLSDADGAAEETYVVPRTAPDADAAEGKQRTP